MFLLKNPSVCSTFLETESMCVCVCVCVCGVCVWGGGSKKGYLRL